MKIKSVKQMGAIALLGVVFALGGCAEKTIDAERQQVVYLYKDGCKAGKIRNNLFYIL